MSSTSYTAVGGSRLAGRDRTIYWTEADPTASGLHHIVAASARGKLPVVHGIPLPPARMRGLVATEHHLIWHDGAMLRVAALAEGSEVMHVEEPGLAWLTCLVADRGAAYYARANDSGGSVIGAVDPATATTRQLAEVAGTVDQLVVVGEHLAWTLHGASDVYVQAAAGGAPALLYSASEPFALCAAGADHLVLAVGATLVRLALATGEVATLADQLAAGWPQAVVWHVGVAHVARREVVVGGARLGSCVERVDLAEGTAHVVHAPGSDHRIDHMVANDHGAFCLERAGAELVAIVHVTPEPVPRTVIEQRGTRTGGGIRIDAAYGKLRAGFTGEVTSCVELVKRIASEAPRRLELLCAPSSPGELWSSACIGHTLPSVEALVAPNGSLGQLADMFTALPSLRQAFVAGELALEPFEHAALRELHFESETLRPTFAKALATSQLPALERCALTFKRVSTASLLRLVDALSALRGLRIVHFGGLRGPDQIRDVMIALTDRRVGWELISFNGALGGEEQWLDVAESIKPPGALRVALPLADMLGDGAAAQLRRHRWLCDVAGIGWEPGAATF